MKTRTLNSIKCFSAGFGAAVFFAATIVSAASPGMTLAECAREALNHNPGLRSARATANKANALKDSGTALFLPAVDLSANRTFDHNAVSATDTSYALSVKQSLFKGFADVATVRQLNAQKEAAEAGIAKDDVDLAFELRIAFVQSIYARDLSQLQANLFERQQSNLRLVQMRFEGGRENKGSVLKSQAAFDRTKFELDQAQRSRRVHNLELAVAMGRSVADSMPMVEVSGVLPAAINTDVKGRPEERGTDDVSKHPTVRSATLQAEAAGFAAQAARGRYYPEIAASASWTNSLEKSGALKSSNSDVRYAISLNLPLDVSGSIRSDVHAAVFEKARIDAQLESALGVAVKSLAQASQDLEDAAGRLAYLESSLKASNVQVEISRSQYSLGLIAFQDWDRIEGELIDNEKALLAGRLNLALAQSAMAKALGRGLPELIAELP